MIVNALAIIGGIVVLIAIMIGCALYLFFHGTDEDDYESRAYPPKSESLPEHDPDVIGERPLWPEEADTHHQAERKAG